MKLREALVFGYSLISMVRLPTTLIVLKPDLVCRGLAARAMAQVPCILQAREFQWHPQLAREFYSEHRGKPFYAELIDSLVDKRSLALLVGLSVHEGRKLVLRLRPQYSTSLTLNSFHASDSTGSFKNEYQLVFNHEFNSNA